MTVSEKLLIEGCAAGDRASQFRLYQMFGPAMLGVCLRYSKNKEDAEEILQEAFLRVFKYLHQFQGIGSLEGWIRKIMIHSSLDRYKKKSRLPKTVNLYEGRNEMANEIDITGELHRKDLLELIQKLPNYCRMVFNLYVFEGYKHKEIAEMLQISEGTSKSNLFDAKKILKKSLTKQTVLY